jgi:hypothetical protein
MKNNETGSIVEVHKHICTRGFWEFYIIDNKVDSDIREAVVMGSVVERGDVCMSEIKPFIITQSSNLTGVMPAPGWEWVK